MTRILFVEDNLHTARAVKLTLELRGYAVDTAGSVAEARKALGASAYNVLITDITLPDGFGFDLLAEKNVPPAIALSGYTAVADREAALAHGFRAYLAKPFQMTELIAEIERATTKDSSSQ